MDAPLGFLPEGLTLFSAALLIFASFFTSALTAAVGVGGGLLMLGLMTYIVPIAALIPVHGLVQLGSNTGRSYLQRDHINWPIVRFFLAGSLLGVLLGAMIFIRMPLDILKGVLGLFILVIVWVKLPQLKKANPIVVAIGGAGTTFVSLFVGATGPLVAVFLSKLFDSHKQMVATHGMTMTVQHLLKVIAFGFVGFAFWNWLPLVLLIVISGFAGTKFGTVLLGKVPEEKLKLGFKIVITVVAFDLLRTAFL
jgi:uncharacterized membrane protein YfcA